MTFQATLRYDRIDARCVLDQPVSGHPYDPTTQQSTASSSATASRTRSGQHQAQPRDARGAQLRVEIATATALGNLGLIDANRGDPQNGWDAGQLPHSVIKMIAAMIEIARAGGFISTPGPPSVERRDRSFRAMSVQRTSSPRRLNAALIVEDGQPVAIKRKRYAGWDGDFGRR